MYSKTCIIVLVIITSLVNSFPISTCEICLHRSGTWVTPDNGEGKCVFWGQKFPPSKLLLIGPKSTCPLVTSTINPSSSSEPLNLNPASLKAQPPISIIIDQALKIIWLGVAGMFLYHYDRNIKLVLSKCNSF